MKIVYLNDDNSVREILPEATYEKGPAFWYGNEFSSHCVQAPNDVEQGMIYDPNTESFSVASEPTDPEPTAEDQMRADIDFCLAMLGVTE